MWPPHKKKNIGKIGKITEVSSENGLNLGDLTKKEPGKSRSATVGREKRKRDLTMVCRKMEDGKTKVEGDYLFIWDTRET